jgi:Kef-type K+ transport system membrane component KefB
MRPRSRLPLRRFAAPLLAFLPSVAWASGGGAAFLHTLLAMAIVLVGSKVGGDLAQRLGQPGVLGELVAGVLLGNLHHVGVDALGFIARDPTVDVLAQLGAVVLLFEVGLESTVTQMRQVGVPATVVAVLGVLAPMLLGYGVGAWLLPEASLYVHLFLGATLSATSVGITARVLQDLGESQSPEARVILGAAVIDDVLGLIVLAAVSGLISAADRGEDVAIGPLLVIVAKAVGFLVGAIAVGTLVMPRVYRVAARMRGNGILLGVSLAFAFLLAWAAGAAGLAPIVGAFAAGLVLEGAMFEPFSERGGATSAPEQLEHLVHPIGQMLAPMFFVVMGFRVDLAALADPQALVLAAALTVAAILGKQACALGVGGGLRRLAVGVGMIPRGEVGLIFAQMGLAMTVDGKPVVDASTFSAIVIMVILTTLLTPPALAWALRRGGAGGATI